MFFFTQPDPKNLAPPIAVSAADGRLTPKLFYAVWWLSEILAFLLAALIRFDLMGG